MICTIVHVWVKPECREAFIIASKRNHENSIKEPGNVRFDLMVDADDPNKFVFSEVYKTQEDIDAHKTTEHYLTWRDSVVDMMAQPRKGVKHFIVAPLENELW